MQAQKINKKDTYDMRPDLDESLTQNHIDPSTLSPFQRILLTTDGTLTEILEAYLFEHIQIVKLSENLVSITRDILPLDVNAGIEAIEHKLETFKEIVNTGKETADELSEYFKIKREDYMLHRTYRVFSRGKPIMMITEKFPEKYFLKNF
ncbi:MAG: hypothetical protein NVS2B14_02440 [Chamaesiphon sp.]